MNDLYYVTFLGQAKEVICIDADSPDDARRLALTGKGQSLGVEGYDFIFDSVELAEDEE